MRQYKLFIFIISISLTSCEQIQNTLDSVFGKKTETKDAPLKTEAPKAEAPKTETKKETKDLQVGSFATITVGSYLYFRKEPIVAEYTKFRGSKLRRLYDGYQVKIIQKTNKCERISGDYGCWYQVEYLGTNGYVFGAFLN